MNEPRNVTPGQTPDSTPEWFGWSWSGGGGRNFPWLGVLLVLVGAALLIQYFVPNVSIGTLILLAIGVAFTAGWLFGRSFFALILGLLVLAVAVARLIDELGIYRGPGTTSVCVAAALLLIWLIGYSRGRRSTWPLWGAAIFGLIGGVQVAARLTPVPDLGAIWPALIIALGILLLLNARRGPQAQPRLRR